MVRRQFLFLYVVATSLGAGLQSVHAAVIVTWDEIPLGPDSVLAATASDQSPIVSAGVELNRTWATEFNCCPGGWAISNQRDQSTPGTVSAYSAFVRETGGGGHDSSNFAVASSLQPGEATVGFAQPAHVLGMYVTNVTYAHKAVVEGDDGAGFVSGPFAVGDWFRLEAIGFDASGSETGRVPLYLADYRISPPQVLDAWTWWDLTPLGSHVARMEFTMNSTDSGMFGMNTPAYFAVDDLTYEFAPEPSTSLLLSAGLFCLGMARRRRAAQSMAFKQG
jgi:hypothetical protein